MIYVGNWVGSTTNQTSLVETNVAKTAVFPPSWDPKLVDPVASLEGGRWKTKIIQKSPSRKETKIGTPPKNGGLMWFVDVFSLFHLASFSSFLLSCFVLGGWNPLGYTVYMMSWCLFPPCSPQNLGCFWFLFDPKKPIFHPEKRRPPHVSEEIEPCTCGFSGIWPGNAAESQCSFTLLTHGNRFIHHIWNEEIAPCLKENCPLGLGGSKVWNMCWCAWLVN